MADVGVNARFEGMFEWDRRRLDFRGRTLVMGILNVTPDSFSDGGRYFDADRAIAHGLHLAEEGADVIDVGGQSTRPGSEPVGFEAELERVVPVICELANKLTLPISIDTTQSKVAEAALDAGAAMVNDISALRFDESMADLVAERQVPVVLMHMQGTPADMQIDPRYEDVIGEIKVFLRQRIAFATGHGIKRERIIVDVGIGFGKRLEHNLTLLARISEFCELGLPVLVGHSRKRFLGEFFGLEADQRDQATLAVSTYLAGKGVHMVRVHDVGPTRKAVELIHRLRSVSQPPQ
jgi:dihydropteroate synthase